MNHKSAVILSACRTPIGSFGGSLKDISANALGAVVIRDTVDRSGVDSSEIGDVIMGCVLQAGSGMNIARQASLEAGLPQEVPAETINRVCGSGLQAVVHAVEGVRLGYVNLIVAGGTESMSSAPYLLKGARWGYRLGDNEIADSILNDGLTCAVNNCHMGGTAEEVASRYSISRERQDEYSAESQRRAGVAIKNRYFEDEIVPVSIQQRKGDPILFKTDEYPRANTTKEKLAGLRPAFNKEGSVTAGNSSGINDGAAALVVASEEYAAKHESSPLAKVVSFATIGLEPMIMGMGPVLAIQKALERAGLTLDKIDLFELNEAFAAQALAVTQELQLDLKKVNVRGGAIALGHPIGASGARILTTLIYALRAKGGGRGVASLCAGGGMGIAMVVEV